MIGIGWILVCLVLVLLWQGHVVGNRRLISGYNVFLLSMGAWYAAEMTLEPEVIAFTPSRDRTLANICVFLCLGGVMAGYVAMAFRRQAVPNVTLFHPPGLDPDLIWKVFLIGSFIGFFPLFWLTKGDLFCILEDAFVPRKRWTSLFQRARYGDARDVFLELQCFLRGSVLFGLAIIFGKNRDYSLPRKIVAVSVVVYAVARALNSGTRMSVVELLFPATGVVLWLAQGRVKRYLLLCGLPLAASIAFLWSNTICVGRDAGRFDIRDAFRAQYTGFEMFRELVFLTRQVPKAEPFAWGYTYYVQAVNPIPRFLWNSKPREDAGLLLARLQGQVTNGEPKLTIAPGFIGEMYWNFGVPGVIAISLLTGCLIHWWDEWGLTAEGECALYAIYCSGLAVLFMTGRSVNLSNIYGVASLCCVLTVTRRVRQRIQTSGRQNREAV